MIGAGGLGHIGIQCLKAMTPAEVIVIDPSERARALAGEIGADTTVAADGKQVDTILEMPTASAPRRSSTSSASAA